MTACALRPRWLAVSALFVALCPLACGGDDGDDDTEGSLGMPSAGDVAGGCGSSALEARGGSGTVTYTVGGESRTVGVFATTVFDGAKSADDPVVIGPSPTRGACGGALPDGRALVVLALAEGGVPRLNLHLQVKAPGTYELPLPEGDDGAILLAQFEPEAAVLDSCRQYLRDLCPDDAACPPGYCAGFAQTLVGGRLTVSVNDATVHVEFDGVAFDPVREQDQTRFDRGVTLTGTVDIETQPIGGGG